MHLNYPEPVHTHPAQIAVCVRISSNLLELHHCRESKVCRVLSHEFGLVRLYRTFSNYIFRGEAICAGCLCTGSV